MIVSRSMLELFGLLWHHVVCRHERSLEEAQPWRRSGSGAGPRVPAPASHPRRRGGDIGRYAGAGRVLIGLIAGGHILLAGRPSWAWAGAPDDTATAARLRLAASQVHRAGASCPRRDLAPAPVVARAPARPAVESRTCGGRAAAAESVLAPVAAPVPPGIFMSKTAG